MKKNIFILLAATVLLLTFSVPSFAAESYDMDNISVTEVDDEETPSVVFVPSENDITADIEVISGDKVVTAYKIITNNKTQNARTSIQKALRYARNNSSEEDIYTVRLPKGTYYFYSSLDIYSNTVLDLNDSTVLRAGNCAALIRFGTKNSVSYGYDGYKNVTIKNGVLDGNLTGSSSLVRFAHANNIKLDNLTFTNTNGVMHLLTFAASNNVSITNCTFSNMTITENIAKYNCEAVQIDILKSGHFNYPAQDGTPTKNVTVSGCTFKNLQRGVGTHSAFANHYFDNIKITGNTFENIEGYAINAINYTNSLIEKNTVTNCGSGINCGTVTNYKLAHFYGPVQESDLPVSELNTKITDNSITLSNNDYEHVGYGINIIGQDIKNFTDKDGKVINYDYRISGVTVSGNTIISNASEHNFYGIQIEGAYSPAEGDLSSVNIKNNKIIITCNDPAIKTNYGIRAQQCTNINIDSNTILDNGNITHLESGIRLDDSTGCRANNNSVTKTTSFGIKLTNSKNSTLQNNTLKEIGLDGIYIFSSSNSATINYNTIESPDGHGIYVRDSKISGINGNKIYTPKDHGIYITGTASAKKVYNNSLIGINNHGIYLNKDASAEAVYKNTVDIINKDAIGIYLNNNATAKTIDGNKINLKEHERSKVLEITSKAGITLNSKKCAVTSIKNNIIKECNEAGIIIHAVKSGSKATVQGNTVINTAKGIYLSNTASVSSVSSNFISGAKDHGIYLNKSASATKIEKNIIDLVSKKSNGIYLNNTSNAVNILSNKINCGEREESAALKLACYIGININSTACNLKKAGSNTVKNASYAGIAVYNIKNGVKATISANTVIKPKVGIYITNKSECSSITSNYVCGSTSHGIYLNKSATASSVSKNTVDTVSKKANAIYIADSASVKKITYNVINAKKKKDSADLKVKSNNGINISSKKCAVSEIKGNTVKKCSNVGICIYKSKTKPAITKNTVSNSTYGIRYKKATVKSNTFIKCTKAKTKKF